MKNIYILDGGVGQEIYIRAGKPQTPLWSTQVMIDTPQIVKDVHKDFMKAGATIITTNNYTCTPSRLKRDSQIELFEKLQLQALNLAIQAREELSLTNKEISIAGCLPPLVGSYVVDKRTFSEIKNEYEKIVAIQDKYIDIFLIETMSSIKEAKAAVEAAQKGSKPIWLSLTLCDTNPNELRSGESIKEAVEALENYSIDALLFNCSYPESIDQGIYSLRNLDIPFGGYANAFTSINALKPGTTVDKLTARLDINEEKYAEHVMKWIQKGASIVGGCCEVGPSYITYIRNQLKLKDYNITSFKKQYLKKY